MSEKQKDRSQQNHSEDATQNSGMRTAETNQDPQITLEEGRNAASGESPNAAGSTTPSTAEEHVPSTSNPEASDLPSAR